MGEQVASVWFRESRPAREAPLTRSRIVAEAVALLDAEGADRLTMRRLAGRLGSGATTLYWHVDTKDDVLDLALDAVFAEVDLAPGAAGWRGELMRLLTDWRAMLLRHPWSAVLLGRRPLMGPNALACTEYLHALLVDAGLRAPELMASAYALSNYVIGCATNQVGWRTQDEPAVRRAAHEHLRGNAERYPTLAAHMDVLDADWDSSFRRGLEYLLDGITARLG
ncbi:TetR/AcrR family transcriptional regulator [Saccharopolyspora elongata]|uniref:TetR/AcrR family transcriptional regulator n=1 Tax=Saccharopolyspora elongata TaxID=2530387 RepID=A0A4R4YRN4_9PSEU|nr:TetR/AcrR family transcriptional regulator [Saccharopolyspora elongata]TDD47935.1 TetR/AcrR family transcriptional regulator [Saccharopolyspora elongata]